MKLSYKKVKSRPNSVNWKKIKTARELFAVEFIKVIKHNTLMINIDETSFNRHMKINYSWGVKGYPVEAKNSPFSGSVSAWMATLSNGSFIAMLTNETINSHKFRLFLRQLHRWLKNNE